MTTEPTSKVYKLERLFEVAEVFEYIGLGI